jgi:hypothetical protein
MLEQTVLADGEECRFCLSKPGRRNMIWGKYGFAAWDRHPASPGHFLVVPYRHFSDYFDITDEEREELWQLVAAGKKMADAPQERKWPTRSITPMDIISASTSVSGPDSRYPICISTSFRATRETWKIPKAGYAASFPIISYTSSNRTKPPHMGQDRSWQNLTLKKLARIGILASFLVTLCYALGLAGRRD